MTARLKSAIYAVFGVGMLVGIAPEILVRLVAGGAHAGRHPLVGGIALVAGGWIYFACVADFAASGGTPAFWDAPSRLVLNPWFRVVRNPMYIGVVSMVVGRSVWLGSPIVLFYSALVLAGFHLFVTRYEEPHLRRVFGDRYVAYCQRVPRWLPAVSPRRLTSAPLWRNLRT